MAQLYTNENFPRQVVVALRALGHDVLTTWDAGQANMSIPDEDVLAYAAKNGRTLVTLNRRDFIRLHELFPDHAGIIVCKVDPDWHDQAQRIHDAINTMDSLRSALIRVNRR